jgi:sugar O-acyltransferase (sialic acid O-acetyltransferase NeuD family)
MKEILLIGDGGHCKSVIDVLEQEGQFNIAGIIGTDKSINSNVLGYKVIGVDSDIDRFSKIYKYAIVAVGQVKSPAIRIKIFSLLMKSGVVLPKIISPRSYVSKHAVIGSGSIIMHDAVVNANAVVGDNCIINSKALIEHDSIIQSHCHISTNAIINGNVLVGEGSFIGSSAVTNNSLMIKKNSFIKAGTLVQ